MKTITYNPETHVLVPREPSRKMLDDMQREDEEGFWAMYNAAIAAAPQPELAEGSVVAFVLTDKNINHLQVNSVEALVARAKHAHMTDIKLRINGKDEWYEADWIKHLKLSQSQPEPVESEPVGWYDGETGWLGKRKGGEHWQPVFTHPPADNKPVESKPVAWWNGKETAFFEHEVDGPVGEVRIPLYTTPQPDRVADLEKVLKVARDALTQFLDPEDNPPSDTGEWRFVLEALAKINEALKP